MGPKWSVWDPVAGLRPRWPGWDPGGQDGTCPGVASIEVFRVVPRVFLCVGKSI